MGRLPPNASRGLNGTEPICFDPFYALIGCPSFDRRTKDYLCIEEQERGKKFRLIIKSSLFEGILIDVKGVNFSSLEIVRAKKYFF